MLVDKGQTSWRIQSPSMDSKLKLKRKVPDKNNMQSLEGREKEREREKRRRRCLDVCLGIFWNTMMPAALRSTRWIETVKVCQKVNVVVMMANLL